ncbi:MAG TPA: GNAT family N-acetyltransferase, partial [Planctomycetota bacterium]|nr:GNAT family N-acetyltransferase [Planctomycetota bacterium]
PRIIAYFIFMPGFGEHEQKRYHERGMPLAPATDCSVAPCLADDFQNRGLGSALMGKVLLIAKRLGYKRALLIGGVIATNLRAVHFYTKLGFRQVGTFSTGIENYDMIMDLAGMGEPPRSRRGLILLSVVLGAAILIVVLDHLLALPGQTDRLDTHG